MKNKKLFLKITGASSAIVISFGVALGLVFAGRTNPYIDFDDPSDTISYAATPLKTEWNVSDKTVANAIKFQNANELDWPVNKQESTFDKYTYAALCIDGADHLILDKGFNQSGYQGLVNWVWTNHWYRNQQTVPISNPQPTYDPAKSGSANGVLPTSNNSSDFWKTYSDLIQHGAKSLVLPGYMHQDGLSNFKNQPNSIYSAAGYILLDANTADDLNIASIVFRSDEAAFMTGIATCQYLNDNFAEYGKNGLSVGTFGGVNIPTVTIYMGGFEQGVIAWNNNIEKIAQYHQDQGESGWDNPEAHKVNFINLGKTDSYFSNSFAIGDGKPLVQALLQRGADAILPVAGPQTIDTVKEIQAYGSSCIVVGVDTAQELDTNTNGRSVYKDVNGDANVIKFSATKNIAGITSQILSLSYAGLPDDSTFTSGDPKVGSYGYLTVGNTENDGIAPSEYSYRYIEEFITSVTDGVTPPDDAIYTWILEELSGLPPPDGTQESYFDWLSQPENMVFKI